MARVIILLLFLYVAESCDLKDDIVFDPGITQNAHVNIAKRAASRRYILYEVNPGEGFNLRRDVYMRIANLVKKLNKDGDWVLVLPPWGRIYHWKSRDIGPQIKILWSSFFDIKSLNLHIPVIEFPEYLKETGKPEIDQVYYLQHYAEGWSDSGWEEKMDIRPCIDDSYYDKDVENNYRSWFWGYQNVYAKNFTCLSIQGQSSSLIPLLKNSTARSIMIDRAETILHDTFGDSKYWKVRRSMRFAEHLRRVGDEFRELYLNSTDEKDKTTLEPDWRNMQRQHGSAFGGSFVACHLRRADFLHGHSNEVPSIKYAAKHILRILKKLNLTIVFIATDASLEELDELRSYLPNLLTYIPSKKERQIYKDGGIAIIDQWICAHARYFIGTHESTFTFRIQEEREILGFQSDVTFNRFCPDKTNKCEKPSVWKIVY